MTKFLYNHRTDVEKGKNFERSMAEYNRNICLALAQICWIALVGRADVVSRGLCTAFGVLTHLMWLSAFCWTGDNYHCIFYLSSLEN